MNGLLSSRPTASAVRLTVSGFLLLLTQSALLLLSPDLDATTSMLIWFLTGLATLAFLVALVGIPETGKDTGRDAGATPR
ncbi:hypothetical protein [Novosphingobium kaempferiae]|uniref:hypothetical protein n=1 Tax=Novosphingobium kaempferiae TaxID=2896849 RepID=UPI001E3D0EFE|nr:hypothetical protein [Novosphingobium kaempferiae]